MNAVAWADATRSAAEPVVALHCSASSGQQWLPYRGLLPADTVLLAPDLMGYGSDTEWKMGDPVSLDDEAERIMAGLPAAGCFHLVGHSYGGAVALQLALRWPERVRTLALYEPVRFGLLLQASDHHAIAQGIVDVRRRIGELVEAGRLEPAAALFVDYWSGEGAWASLREARRSSLVQRMPKVEADFQALFSDRVPPASFARLRMPVCLMAGGRSPLPTQKLAQLLAALCPQSELVHFAELGHMGPITHPAVVAPHLALNRTPLRYAA